ncbi:MAG: response regulator, partial [Deltaproteobacteria bacterium]|nr:response regulator [Deltaproteobacteria bacterium]
KKILDNPGQPLTFEIRYKCKNGEFKWIEFTGVNLLHDNDIKGVLGNYHDISNRKKSEIANSASIANITAIMENTTDSIWTINQSYEVIYINSVFKNAYKASFNITLEPGTNLLESLPEYLIPIWKSRYDRVLAGERFSIIDEVPTATGTIFIEVLFNPIVINNEVTGASFFGRDITSRKLEELEREKLQAQLTQAQKMESVGRLAGGVAHDFNNMLGVIIGHADMLLDGMAANNENYIDLTEILNAAKRSADLTRQLLAFARKQTIIPKALDLNKTVDGMLKMLGRLIGENVELIWKPSENLNPVMMDPSQIDQILANLCVNAHDAINGVGSVIIETENIILDDKFCNNHEGAVPGEYVLLKVSDSGIGMTQNVQEHLFEPFFTTKEVGEGTGLGLSTIYGIVKQNNGYIKVTSKPDEGSTFYIYLPKHNIKGAIYQSIIPGSTLSMGSETILIVEDDPAILSIVSKMLKTSGYNLLTTNNPIAAIDLAKEHENTIHLLLTDIIMPEMNGHDLSQKIIEIHPDIKTLFMSGYTADIISTYGVTIENINFLQKPFTRQILTTAISKVLHT